MVDPQNEACSEDKFYFLKIYLIEKRLWCLTVRKNDVAILKCLNSYFCFYLLEYVVPEVFGGIYKESPARDIWSVGVTVFRMATQQVLYVCFSSHPYVCSIIICTSDIC